MLATKIETKKNRPLTKKGWNAELNLGFVRRDHKTVLSHRSHIGPLTVQRPFYPEGVCCHVYILHPPGGIVSGDQLAISISVDKKAKALITTPGASKFYRSSGEQALQTIVLSIKEDATLEWLPQETIVFEGARLVSNVQIDLAENARFIAWEILVLGRPASGEGFNQGEAFLNWQINQQSSPIFLEKMRLDSESFVARWGLDGHPCCGSLFAKGASAENLEAVRQLIADTPRQGVTLIDDLLICRASAKKAQTVRLFFEEVRQLIRNDIVQQQPYTPRIWAT